MIRPLVFLLLAAVPAGATVEGWPALYDVTGVASDDVLNIRSEAGTSGEVIGTLAHDGTDIEVIRPNDDLTWGLVNTSERSGWVSLAYLVRKRPGQWDGQFPQVMSCYGTEPFWDLTRSNGTVEMDTAFGDGDSITAPIEWEAGTINHRGRHSMKAGDIVVVFSNRACSDGMSDRDYGIEANVILLNKGEHYQGCCSIAPR